MLTIVSLKIPSGKPTDAVDTVNHSVFLRLNETIRFVEPRSFWDTIRLLRTEKPNYALGLGSVREILFIPFLARQTHYVIAWHTLLRKTKAWPIRKLLFRVARFVIAVSACAARTITQFFPNKSVHVVLNGVDTDFFSPKKSDKTMLKRFGVDTTKPIVLFVGALMARKRPELVVEIAKRYPGAQFVLVGRQDSYTVPANSVNVIWIPSLTREEISIAMASSDIFLFPSINEPCAAVIPEAMASGLPMLLSKDCGNAELMSDDVEGFLIEPNNEEIDQFIYRLDEILTNPKLKASISKASRQRCIKELNWKKVSQQYLQIFLNNYK